MKTFTPSFFLILVKGSVILCKQPKAFLNIPSILMERKGKTFTKVSKVRWLISQN